MQDSHSTAHTPLANICLNSYACIAALIGGLTITAIIFVKSFWLH